LIHVSNRVKAALVAAFFINKLMKISEIVSESASGYIPSKKQANDPRYKTALTVDIKPDSIKNNAAALGLGNIHRSGIPQIANANGKVKKKQ
jgi:hypothetical protein